MKGLIITLLICGSGLSKIIFFSYFLAVFAAITWNNSSNDILRSLAVTGLVTVFASMIGLIGCNR